MTAKQVALLSGILAGGFLAFCVVFAFGYSSGVIL